MAGGEVLLTGQAVVDAELAARAAIRLQRSTNLRVPPSVTELHAALQVAVERLRALPPAAVPEVPRQRYVPASRATEQITAEETAVMLGCGKRNVRDLARRGVLQGRKVAGSWHFDRAQVLSVVRQRRGVAA